MCEWLSQGEWCDVKLLCGGHSFNAHRAVLASVSTFLRRILLACPADEAPTYIVLPDFDLGAMSSVLYYIYNGEVILQKNKIALFLDIIQALQIYIDCQYLPRITEVIEDRNFDLNSCYDADVFKTDIFTLGFCNDKQKRFFNLKKGTEIQNVLLQYSQEETNFHDNIAQCQNESELHRSRLGNLKSSYGDRQRNSFLRDLFIETYPRNGNVNGLTESVLAISNECYRSPASALSANANGEHLGSDDAVAKFCTKTTEQGLNTPAIFHSGHHSRSTNNYNGKFKPYRNETPGLKSPKDTNDTFFIYGNSETLSEFPQGRVSMLPHQFNDPSTHSGTYTSSLSFQQSFLEAMKTYFLKDFQCVTPQSFLSKSESGGRKTDLKSHSTSKIIFNQVLENPWNPRKPNDFRPSRRKENKSKNEVDKIALVNDSNNNIQQPALELAGQNLTNRVSIEPEPPKSCSSPMPVVVGTDSFKCAHCHQVFTSSESLEVHMRRHSTTARYTCGECGKTFSQLRNFKYHMSIHRGTREFAATCTVCGKYFNDRGYLSSHMKIHRNRKEYKCTLCPKSFNQRVAYNMHVRIHTGVKPHVCEECGKAFSRKMLLKQHQRTHSGERPYACPHCDKRFADRSNMTLHLRLHTGVKPFSCSLCPKSFTKKHHLKSHLNFHTGSKPYSCPRCKLAFTQSSNMRTHYKKCIAPDPGSSNDSQSNS